MQRRHPAVSIPSSSMFQLLNCWFSSSVFGSFCVVLRNWETSSFAKMSAPLTLYLVLLSQFLESCSLTTPIPSKLSTIYFLKICLTAGLFSISRGDSIVEYIWLLVTSMLSVLKIAILTLTSSLIFLLLQWKQVGERKTGLFGLTFNYGGNCILLHASCS